MVRGIQLICCVSAGSFIGWLAGTQFQTTWLNVETIVAATTAAVLVALFDNIRRS